MKCLRWALVCTSDVHWQVEAVCSSCSQALTASSPAVLRQRRLMSVQSMGSVRCRCKKISRMASSSNSIAHVPQRRCGALTQSNPLCRLSGFPAEGGISAMPRGLRCCAAAAAIIKQRCCCSGCTASHVCLAPTHQICRAGVCTSKGIWRGGGWSLQAHN